jgi:hypothetical protein
VRRARAPHGARRLILLPMAASAKGRYLVPLAVALLLALHAGLALWAVSGKSTTADEIIHVTGGQAYWTLHDYRLHPENGILPQRWAALPSALSGVPFPKLVGNPYWKTSEVQAVGHQFFYETGHDHFPMLMRARAMILLFNVATGALIFVWSRRLFGTPGAFVSLALFGFSPNFLAHGALATSDACMTFFFLASVGAWWRHLHDGRARWWWISSVAFGFAWVAKYSAPLLLPMMILMALARAWSAPPLALGGRTITSRGGKFGAAALSAVGHGFVAIAVIWACYGFRYAAFNPALPPADHFIRPWEVLDLHIGFAGQFLRACASVHLLPEAFLYGFAYVLETAQVRSAFLNGDYSTTGWVSFFPWAFALKTTLPVLAACIAVVALVARRWLKTLSPWREDLYRVAPLASLFVVYWIFSLTSHLNIGHRHILPTYPVIYIAAGALGAWLISRRIGLVAAGVAVLAGQVTEAIRAAPHFLAYFNVLGGGPENGHRHLVDSSLDWGQDLPGLKTWLVQSAGEAPVFLSYFGTGEPDYYGIRARRLPFVNGFKIPQPFVRLESGTYCISATMLSHVYSSIRGPWTLELEKEYQDLRAVEPLFADYVRDSRRREELNRDATEAQWRRSWTRHDALRFARLCYYLRLRQPDAQIGYSILIYRLSAEEVTDATAGSLGAWRRLIERTVEPVSRP